MSTPAETPRLETLNILIGSEERKLIALAAQIAGKSFDEFIHDTLIRSAQDTLVDQVNIVTTPAQHAEFLRLLDAPTAPSQRLRKTMQTPVPWKRK